MTSMPIVITVESSDEDEDVVFLYETRAPVSKNNSIMIMDSPYKSKEKPEVRINKAKLESLRRNVQRSRIGNARNVKHATTSKMEPRNEFKINKARLKKLKAVVKIKLDSYRPKAKRSSSCLDGGEEKMKVLEDPESSIYSPLDKRFSPAKYFQSPTGTQPDLNGDRFAKNRTFVAKNLFQSPTHSQQPAGHSSQKKLTRSLYQSPNRRQRHLTYHSPFKSQNNPISSFQFPSDSPTLTELHSTFNHRQSPATTGLQPMTHSPSLAEAQSLTQESIKTWLTPTRKTCDAVPDKVSAVQQVVTAKRNEVVWPPTHVIINLAEFVSKLYKAPRLFSGYYNDIIEGLQDEKLFYQVVRTVQSFMSSQAAPTSDLIWCLVNDVLLNSCSRSLSYATYCLLNEIHTRFPFCCLAMHIQWRSIEKLTEQVLSFFTNGCKLQNLNGSLALVFIINVVSSQVKSTALKARPTGIAKYFSADFDTRNMKEIIAGLKVCISNHSDTCGNGNCPAAYPSTCTQASLSSSTNVSICTLELFQNLLKLVIISSSNKESVAIRIADELMYLYIDLRTLQTRIMLLRTLKSHLIRRYLIQVLLMNYCSPRPEALKGNDIPFTARKIVLQDFNRFPPKRSDWNDGDIYTSEEVEEYVTLVAYLLQSFISLHTPMLLSYHPDAPLYPSEQVTKFTPEDVEILGDMKSHTRNLRERCGRFLGQGQRMSMRTELLLEMMEMMAKTVEVLE